MAPYRGLAVSRDFMAVTLKFLPGSTIRWRDRQYLIVDYVGLDAVLARELGKVKLERIPVSEAQPNHAPRAAWIAPDLVGNALTSRHLDLLTIVVDAPSPGLPRRRRSARR